MQNSRKTRKKTNPILTLSSFSRKFLCSYFWIFLFFPQYIGSQDFFGITELRKKVENQEEKLKKQDEELDSLNKEMKNLKSKGKSKPIPANSLKVDKQEEKFKKQEEELNFLRKEIESLKSNLNKSQPVSSLKEEKSKIKETTSNNPEMQTKSLEPKKYEIRSKGLKIETINEENIGKRYAILIGINEYKDQGISKLKKARNDAKIFGKVLKESGQFDQVFVMTDDIDPRIDPENLYPSKLNIEEKLDSIVRFINPQDMVIFFFSGHGVADMEDNAYLVAVDTVVDKQFNTSVSINSIVERFKTHDIKKSLLILDACRDVLYTSKSSSRNSLTERNFSGSELAGTFYSTKAGFYSYEDDETDYGVFTKYLVMGAEGQADTNKDGVVVFSELEQFVHKGVRDWSVKKNKQQKPYTKIYGEKTGDLVITVASESNKSLVEKKIKEPSRLRYVWKSALVPGWGQWDSGSNFRGSSYFLAGLGFLGYHVKNLSNLKNAQTSYNSATPFLPGDLFPIGYMNILSKKEALQKANSAAFGSYAVLLVFWLWNVTDASLFTELPKENTFSFDYNIYRTSSPLVSGGTTETVHSINWNWRF